MMDSTFDFVGRRLSVTGNIRGWIGNSERLRAEDPPELVIKDYPPPFYRKLYGKTGPLPIETATEIRGTIGRSHAQGGNVAEGRIARIEMDLIDKDGKVVPNSLVVLHDPPYLPKWPDDGTGLLPMNFSIDKDTHPLYFSGLTGHHIRFIMAAAPGKSDSNPHSLGMQASGLAVSFNGATQLPCTQLSLKAYTLSKRLQNASVLTFNDVWSRVKVCSSESDSDLMLPAPSAETKLKLYARSEPLKIKSVARVIGEYMAVQELAPGDPGPSSAQVLLQVVDSEAKIVSSVPIGDPISQDGGWKVYNYEIGGDQIGDLQGKQLQVALMLSGPGLASASVFRFSMKVFANTSTKAGVNSETADAIRAGALVLAVSMVLVFASVVLFRYRMWRRAGAA